MTLDPWTLATIAGMAIVTYACRAGGYWVFRQIKPSPAIRSVLSYIPGTLFVAYVVPAIIAGGVQSTVGTAATIAVMAIRPSMTLAILIGTSAAWAIWSIS